MAAQTWHMRRWPYTVPGLGVTCEFPGMLVCMVVHPKRWHQIFGDGGAVPDQRVLVVDRDTPGKIARARPQPHRQRYGQA